MIYYIAGAGRSGSTLLDIILGNIQENFSLGELNFFVSNGLIDNEYCSCRTAVPQCKFWSEVLEIWQQDRVLTDKGYILAQNKFLRNKRTFSNLWNFYWPSKIYLDFCADTRKLYDAIYQVSGSNILVDSSKNVQNILILRKIGVPFKIIHLTRKFSGVLNSTQKELRKDREKGIERELKPQSFFYAFKVYLFDNFLTILFSFSKERIRIRYENIIRNTLNEISKVVQLDEVDIKLLSNRGPLSPKHLVAGNKLRMTNEIYINRESDSINNSLNPLERIIVRIIDCY